jgi:transcriptional regulator with XRE-family HTH domain
LVIYYRFAEVMPTCISEKRYGTVHPFMERVWIAALRRLMAAQEPKGWKQQDLAAHSGVRPNTISDILAGSDPRVDTMAALAKAFDVPLWALFCDEQEYARFTALTAQAQATADEHARMDEVRAAIQAELEPVVAALVAKHTGQSVAPQDHPLPGRPLVVRKRKAAR